MRLGDLLTHPLDGVEGIHRALEDDADLAPAVATHRFVGLARELDAHQPDAAVDDLRVPGQDPDQRQGGGRLSAPGFAGDPERLPVVEREADAVDRLDRSRLEGEVGLEALDLEQPGARDRLLGEWPLPPPLARRQAGASSLAELVLLHLLAVGRLDRFELVGSDAGWREARTLAGRDQRSAHRRRRRFGLNRSSSAPPTSVKANTTSTMHAPGRHEVPPGAQSRRADLARRVEDLPPRRLERIAESDEGERRLGQDGTGEDEHRVGDDEVDHVGQHVDAHDVASPGADDARAVDERALLQRERLRPDDPGRRRPAGDADHDHDGQEAEPDAERARSIRRRRRPG